MGSLGNLKELDYLKHEDIINVLRIFIKTVEFKAEEKMLKTGKLEGAHYTAMKQVFKEWETKA